MKLSEVPFEEQAGLLVRRRDDSKSGYLSDRGQYAIVEKSYRYDSGQGGFTANIGAGAIAAADPTDWEVIPTSDVPDNGMNTIAFAFLIASQKSRSGMDGFLMALNLVRQSGLPMPPRNRE